MYALYLIQYPVTKISLRLQMSKKSIKNDCYISGTTRGKDGSRVLKPLIQRPELSLCVLSLHTGKERCCYASSLHTPECFGLILLSVFVQVCVLL